MKNAKLKGFFPSIYFLCIFLLLFVFSDLLAQDPYYIQYDETQGLPSSEVYGIEEDKYGMLWFVTDRGLTKYDGYGFQVMELSRALGDHSILYISKFNNQNLWVTSLKGYIYHQQGDTFEKLLDEPISKLKSDDLVIHISEVNLVENGNYYIRLNVLIDEYCLYDPINDSISIHSYSTLPNIHIENLDSNTLFLEIDSNNYWLYSKSKDEFGRPFSTSEMTTNSSGDIAFSYYTPGGAFSKIMVIRDNKCTLLYEGNIDCFRCYFDSDENLWCWGKNGLYRFRNDSILAEPDHFFKGLHMLDFLMDREGSYWISAHGLGVLRVPSFDLIGSSWDNTDRTKHIRSIASLDSILFIQNYQNESTIEFYSGDQISFDKEDDSPWTNSVIQLTNSIQELTIPIPRYSWVSSIKGSLPKGTSINCQHASLINGDVFQIGYRRVFVNRGKERIFTSDYSLYNDRLTYVNQSSEGEIWIGGLNGLYKLDTNYKMTVISEEHPHLKTRISDLKFLDKSPDKLWVATQGSGVSFISRGISFQLSSDDGLSSNVIQCIYNQGDSILWAGAINGLNRIRYQLSNDSLFVLNIQTYVQDNGLPSDRVNAITKWKNQLYVATSSGIIRFNENALQPNFVAPTVYLEEVKADSEQLSLDNDLEKKTLQRNIQFNYTGISHHKPITDYFYRYKLNQEDEISDWSYTNGRNVQFTNLSPGEYSFILQAQNNFGYWSVDPIQYQFSILPHYYETWWFIGFVIIISVLFIAFLVFLRFYIIRNKLKHAIQIRDSELRLLRTQMTPHFVFNLINGIQQLIFDNNPEKASSGLSKISRLMLSNMDFVKRPYITLEEELLFVENYLAMEKFRFDEDLSYNIVIDNAIEFRTKEILIPPFMVQPLLENAVKHGTVRSKEHGTVDLYFNCTVNYLEVEVIDNGVGIDSTCKNDNKIRKHALDILNERVALINDEWPETTATFSLKNRLDNGENKSGVRASLKIPLITNL